MELTYAVDEAEVFVFPASYAQQRLWFLDQFEPGSPYYNIPMAVRLIGKLNIEILEKSILEIIERHESLRTTFATLNNQPVQIIHPSLPIKIKFIDLSEIDEKDKEAEAQRLARIEASQGFDLQNGPLLRVQLIRISEREHIVLLTMHHIISDGWSMSIFTQELFTLYEAFNHGKPSPLPPLPLQYADYSEWQLNWLRGEILENQLSYWREQLADIPAVLEIPTDRPRPAIFTNNGANLERIIEKNLVENIKSLSQKEGATLFMTLLAAFQVLLYRYSHQNDICVGTPIANRTREEIEQIIGLFINTLVIRSRVNGETTFRKFLSEVKEVALGAYAHQDIPFEMLVEALQPERDMSHSPLFQVMFILQNATFQTNTRQSDELQIYQIDVDSGTATFDLTLSVSEQINGLSVSAEYNTDLFNRETIENLLRHYENLLRSIVANPEEKLNYLQLLSEEEKIIQLIDWNNTTINYPNKHCLVHELFEIQVEKTPDAIAAIVPDREDITQIRQITYAELNCKANILAHYLRKSGVGPEIIVGLCMTKSIEMIIGILGILKSGGAYLPIDPLYPTDRLSFMLADSQVNLILTQAGIKNQIPIGEQKVICLDADWKMIAENATFLEETNPAHINKTSDLVYMIYTSGSTGQAKGVMVEHRNLVNAYLAWETEYNLKEIDVHLQMANFSFDVFSGDLVRALCSGGKLVLCHREFLLSPEILYALMVQEKVNVAEFVPAVLRLLIQYLEKTGKNLSFMRLLICGSDSWFADEYRSFLRYCGANTRLINSFGLTEATIDSTFFEGSLNKMQGEQVVPIGRPFPNTKLLILDDYQQLVPVGVKGELYIGGSGIARGYFNQPEMTRAKFICNPFREYWDIENDILYRTGDAVRYLHDGNVEFLGRLDFQVKIRGFRVETGEVEATIKQFPGIIDALVLAATPPKDESVLIPINPRLVGYIVADKSRFPENQYFPISDLILFLKTKLPDYMVPSNFVLLERFPLTPNGKIDRQALPEPDWSKREAEAEYIAPRNQVEEVLAGIWSQFLGISSIGVYDNFFELGGHSLLATQVISRIRDAFDIDIPLRVIFETPTISGLAEQVNLVVQKGIGIMEPPILPIPRDQVIPLSYAQQRLWFLDQLEPNSAFYNLPEAVRLTGPLDIGILEKSLNVVVERHESLRTTFRTVDGVPIQSISSHLYIPIISIDISNLESDEKEVKARHILQEEAGTPFNLSKGPLLRAKLIILSKDNFILLLTMHHIIGDNWSSNILVQELTTLYTAFSNDRPNPLPPLTIQYPDYAYWQRNWLKGEVLESQIDYWKKQLANLPPILELPLDRPRQAIQTFNGTFQSFELPEDITRQLNLLTKKEGVTMFMLLLATFEVLLYRYSNQEDITVGSPIANRNRSQIENLIGFFVNTLVLRAQFFDEPVFREHLKRVRDTTLAAYAHQDTPFEMIVDGLHPERNLSHSPLFQVMFVIQNIARSKPVNSLISIEPLDVHSGTAKFDLTLFMNVEDELITGAMEYNTDLFNHDTISRMIGHLINLLRAIGKNQDVSVAFLPILSEDEKNKILYEWNQTQAYYPSELCAHQLFEKQVRVTPDVVAVQFEDEQLTYEQLDRKANILANYLVSEGVKPETLVGICLERSLEMVIAILGILKSGGAYVPLDPNYPADRLEYMITDASIFILLSKKKIANRILKNIIPEKCRIVLLDSDWEKIAMSPLVEIKETPNPDNLAYVIYTSGSTGKPKGTMILHRGLVNYLTWCKNAYPLTKGQGSPVHSSISFDLTVTSIFTPLISGKKVLLLPEEQGVEILGETLRREKNFSLVKITPAHLQLVGQQLKSDEALERTFAFIIGGENLTSEHIEFWQKNAPDTLLINEYGPTETVVGCCVYTVPKNNTKKGVLPIGKPIINTQLYVLDKHLQPVPVGVHGELCIGGAGVARGYLNRKELTEEKFIKDPFSNDPNARLYRTGDLARYLPDGSLECLGRIDFQVKIRGFRVELGEIEKVIAQHTAVRDVVVWTHEIEGVKRLVAYLVPNPGLKIPDSSVLEEYLSKFLPEYMIPTTFMELASLPLNANGKVDRKLLPLPEQLGKIQKEGYIEPKTYEEKILADIWSKVLGISPVGVNDNFFDLGGDSILSIQIIVKANQAGLGITPRLLFENPTIAELARVAGTAKKIEAEQGIVIGSLPLTPIQHWFFDLNLEYPNHWNQSIYLAIPIPLRKDYFEQAIKQIIKHHDALRLRFEPTKVEGRFKWVVYNAPFLDDDTSPVEWVSLQSLDPAKQLSLIEEITEKAQSSLDITNGPLIKAVYFDLGSQNQGRLLITVHHLVIDGVSWRILLEDFQSIYSNLVEGKIPQLPRKTTSFKDWAIRLSNYHQSEIFQKNERIWLDLLNKPIIRIPQDFKNGDNYEGSAKSITVSLENNETRSLLLDVPAVFKTEIIEVLLTALTISMTEWIGSTSIIIDLESHGREEIFEDLDISRTVGWFTVIYPVILELDGYSDYGEALLRVKEQMRKIPQHGLDFGIMRYMKSDHSELFKKWGINDISFNYLGQMDQKGEAEGSFPPALEKIGPDRNPKNKRTHLIDINGGITGGSLNFEWTYSSNIHQPATIQMIADRFIRALQEIIEFCQKYGKKQFDKEDFADFGWGEEDIGDILSAIGKIE